MNAEQYEKLGAFYLGQNVDLDTGKALDEATLYDSADLTTHATIIGMTGSGKTGLGIGLIEEAAMDGVPVLAIDPKGDLGNLLLTFPELKAQDFEPWVDPSVAQQKGLTVSEFAQKQAKLWAKGMQISGQEGRIARLKSAADFRLYTPGSTAGRPISVLAQLHAPDAQTRADGDLYAQHIEATATGILSLLGEDTDPLTSRPHILISNILKHHWDKTQGMDLPALIGAIQNPPLKRIGVLDLDSFYPAKERAKLALSLNGLLASPGFSGWLSGEALSIDALLSGADGRPAVSVMHIAHLSDEERMFFMTLLLAELISWMRQQSGTGSLRAILYIDELFGYMPPTANPPSKKLLLTLLKQARAYGLGLVLSTQNPVDLDYKGLSNCGTWFLGRLQTEQDRARVLDGLTGKGLEKSRIDDLLQGLDKRQFYLHNVHEEQPVVFSTKWCMSYLAGPLSRDQVQRLCAQSPAPNSPPKPPHQPVKKARNPVAEAGVEMRYAPLSAGLQPEDAVYFPQIAVNMRVAYFSKTHAVDENQQLNLRFEAQDPMDWSQYQKEEVTAWLEQPTPDVGYAAVADAWLSADRYRSAVKELARWWRIENPLILFQSRSPKLTSRPGEALTAFQTRLRHQQREEQEQALNKCKAEYQKKLATLDDRIATAQAAVEREKSQRSKSRLDAVISIGGTLLGALLGRKALSKTNINKAGSALKKVTASGQQSDDVKRAEEKLARYQQDLKAMNDDFERALQDIQASFTAQPTLEEISIRARSSDIVIEDLTLVWVAE